MKQISLENIKARELDILKSFDTFCKEHQLKYFIYYGTLLGAVRHQGFIPWDDDIDVVMPRPDYMRFLELTKKRWHPYFEVLSHEHFPHYIYPFAKISDTSTVLIEETLMKQELGVYIDVFPLDGISEVKIEQLKFKNKLIVLFKMLKLSVKSFKSKNILAYLGKCIICPWFRLVGFEAILNMIAKIEQKYNWDDSSYICEASEIRKGYVSKNYFLETTELIFEGYKFSAPKNYEYLLHVIYGDYMTLPPESKRIGHTNRVYIKG